VIFCVRQGATTSHGRPHGEASQRSMAQKAPELCSVFALQDTSFRMNKKGELQARLF